MAHIGIDLGTTNTLVALLSAQGEPEIRQLDHAKMIPSVICIEEPGGHVTVGEAARLLWQEPEWESTRCFRRWKLTMGEDRELAMLQAGDARTNPVRITPEYLTARLVEFVLTQLSKGVGGITIDSVLVTVPHGWRRQNPEKCRATRLAATEARVGGKPVKVQELTVSEPVAAAAYWLWELRRAGASEPLDGKTLLVCDIGGGTFDLSLVMVGAPQRPLDVIDAINNNSAGDYVDALLCAWICQQFNTQFQTVYPTDPEQVLAHLADTDFPWLRDWFMRAKQLKEQLSTRAEHARAGSAIKPVRDTFSDEADHSLPLALDTTTFQTCLQPFYAQGRELIQQFLASHRHHLPYALVPAGGGSRILGVREQVLEPALRHYYSQEALEAVLDRVQANRSRCDEAIALGAALIANRVITVQERLLHDIGLLVELPQTVAAYLKLVLPANLKTPYLKVWLTPVLEKGKALPAGIDSDLLGITTTLMPGEKTIIEVVIEDDPKDPWVQYWEIPHPAGGKKQASLAWSMLADTDGALTLQIRPQQGQAITIEGRLERARTGRASLVLGDEFALSQLPLPPRIAPATLLKAIKALAAAASH